MLFSFQAKNQPSKLTKNQLNLVEFGLVQDAFWTRPVHFLLMLFRFQARNQASKPEIRPQNSRKRINQIWLNLGWQFWWVQNAFWTRPAHFLLMLFSFQARISLQSSQKKNQLNVVDFSVAVWAGPGCFLDPACALLVDVVQVSSQKSDFKAGNQATKFTEKNQPNLVEFCVAILAGPGRFLDPACALLADVVQLSSQNQPSKLTKKN